MNALLDALTIFGIEETAPVLDGTFQRRKCRGSNQRNGWYVAKIHNDHIYCRYGDWRTGDKAEYTNNGTVKTPEIISVWHLLAEAERKKREELNEEAAKKAQKLIDQIPPLVDSDNPPGHPYLEKKGVRAYGEVRVHDSKLIVPAYRHDGSVVGFQSIDEHGEKKFLFGTAKKGACFPIEGNVSTVCICEGYATGASIHEATGLKVLVAFDAGNMVAVAKQLANHTENSSKVLICADNDHGKEQNTGIETAKKILREYGFPYVYPDDIEGTDFNDMYQELGREAVKELVARGRVTKAYQKAVDALPLWNDITNPPGMLKEIAEYFNATSVKPQPLLAVAAGLILGSVLMGRRYNTGTFGNYTSLYFSISAKSGTGKDHVKTVVRRILKAANLDWLERSGGYTAANTVMKSLERQPLQLVILEELGVRLKEAAGNPRSAYNGVFRQLLDIWSSCHSISRGEEYSDGTIPMVDRPALTLIGLSTPKQIFEAMTEALLEQGFCNRLLPFISDAERTATPLQANTMEPPEKIVQWCRSLWPGDLDLMRAASAFSSPSKEDEVVVSFTPEALELLYQIEKEVVAKSEELDKIGLGDLLSRKREITMRVSLIVAVMDDCKEIEARHVEWSWKLVNTLYGRYVDSIKRVSSGSFFERTKKEALADLRNRGEDGLKASAMPKTSPWSKWDQKLRAEVLSELQEAGLADLIQRRQGKRGPAATVWMAIDEP